MTPPRHRHAWTYAYVRGREDVFRRYPFPVWVCWRRCRCGRIEVLVPLASDFNSGRAKWFHEEGPTFTPQPPPHEARAWLRGDEERHAERLKRRHRIRPGTVEG